MLADSSSLAMGVRTLSAEKLTHSGETSPSMISDLLSSAPSSPVLMTTEPPPPASLLPNAEVGGAAFAALQAAHTKLQLEHEALKRK